MNESKPAIRELNGAISSLCDDAAGMHEVITRSTEELEHATAEGRRAADQAEEVAKTLLSLSEELKKNVESANALLVKTDESVEQLAKDLNHAQEAGQEAFEDFATSSQRENEKTRDALQTDLLSHKTAMATRMDSLEATTTKRINDLESAVDRIGESTKSLEQSLVQKTDLLQKKVSLPLYGVVVVAILQLLTLAALFLR